MGSILWGQFVSLLWLILTGLPAAIASVAWIQVANERATPPETNETAP